MVKALALLLCVATAGTAPAPLPVTEVAPGVFVHQGALEETAPDNGGDIANLGFVVGARGVAVIDTGGTPEIGRRLRATIAMHTAEPVIAVILTHTHPDHIFGTVAFAGVPVYGHARLQAAAAARFDGYRQRLADELGPMVVTGLVPLRVDRPVAGEATVDLGDRLLRLTAEPTAHTNNDLTVIDERSGTLFAGDLLFMDRLPVVDGSATGWLNLLDRLEAVPARRVVPGHGPAVADWPDALSPERRYLTALVTGVRRALVHGDRLEEAVNNVAQDERGRWRLFDAVNPRNVTATFAALEWE